ncbi:hypothetical protein CRE_18463 [Caenorhabditis remanei]|uniref:Uncharacterized protein n=1 Tax=Caenorhabditis remanei TaxID=31234 RepID=E3LKM7_CAERE|nr:hypothetical protein CRE_18463 [Caenorhabditis remanei]
MSNKKLDDIDECEHSSQEELMDQKEEKDPVQEQEPSTAPGHYSLNQIIRKSMSPVYRTERDDGELYESWHHRNNDLGSIKLMKQLSNICSEIVPCGFKDEYFPRSKAQRSLFGRPPKTSPVDRNIPLSRFAELRRFHDLHSSDSEEDSEEKVSDDETMEEDYQAPAETAVMDELMDEFHNAVELPEDENEEGKVQRKPRKRQLSTQDEGVQAKQRPPNPQ